ncbi:MAG: hypothetical protein MJZ38_07080 [archaeon]|nr:hypothetical protein [archaeon]
MSQTVEDLLATYMTQSPLAFTAFAIETGEEHVKDYNSEKMADNENEHGAVNGDPACDYCCCTTRGYCKTPAQHAMCIGGIVVCCVCCCYCTNGFNGYYTYWPF